MINKKYLFSGLFVLAFIFAIGVSMNDNSIDMPLDNPQGLEYNANVCVYKNNELVQCEHNVLYDTGAEEIEDYLSLGDVSAGQPINISLCNATAGCGTPTGDSSEDYTEYDACGLEEIAGTVGDNGNGNWSIETTFTSSCDSIETNVTHLNYNATAIEFAGNSFTLVTLQTNDQLTINWTIWIS